jgi:hypothetical protein
MPLSYPLPQLSVSNEFCTKILQQKSEAAFANLALVAHLHLLVTQASCVLRRGLASGDSHQNKSQTNRKMQQKTHARQGAG